MAQPKATYTFSSTREDCSIPRIIKENPESAVIVLTRKGAPTITAVTEPRERLRLMAADIKPIAWGNLHSFAVYAGDVHGIALGLVETKVEAY
jgi:hypothetical protein